MTHMYNTDTHSYIYTANMHGCIYIYRHAHTHTYEQLKSYIHGSLTCPFPSRAPSFSFHCVTLFFGTYTYCRSRHGLIKVCRRRRRFPLSLRSPYTVRPTEVSYTSAGADSCSCEDHGLLGFFEHLCHLRWLCWFRSSKCAFMGLQALQCYYTNKPAMPWCTANEALHGHFLTGSCSGVQNGARLAWTIFADTLGPSSSFSGIPRPPPFSTLGVNLFAYELNAISRFLQPCNPLADCLPMNSRLFLVRWRLGVELDLITRNLCLS